MLSCERQEQTKPKTKKPTAEEIKKAKEAAEQKAAQQKKELEAKIKSDQKWVDEATKDMTGDQKEELFHQLAKLQSHHFRRWKDHHRLSRSPKVVVLRLRR